MLVVNKFNQMGQRSLSICLARFRARESRCRTAGCYRITYI